MSQHHPFDLAASPTDPSPLRQQDSQDSFEPLTDDDLSSFERRLHSPIPFSSDNVVRAQSPFGRRYLKPINGIQIKGFARSAQRRSSVLTLGSIERLQNFYASKDLKVNKGGTLGFQNLTLSEEPEDMEDHLPTPREPPPSWIDLDVPQDLDVLLQTCFDDIQSTLTTWSMVTGPHRNSSSSSSSAEPDDKNTANSFQILPLLESVTKMLSSIKNYSMNRHDLSQEALSKLRHAALDLLETMKELESQYRMQEDNNNEEAEENNGYLYRSSDFDLLEKERQAIHVYLSIVEKYAFNPPHHIGSPPAVFTPEIKALLGKSEILSLTADDDINTRYGVPEWLQRGSFVNNPMGRYHALILDNLDGSFKKQDVPDPKLDEKAFLEFLSDGIVLCNVYNSIVKRSRRPFGLITNIHGDSKRTYRAIENLRFFSAACKFRFELMLPEFDPSEIARKTDKGSSMLKTTLSVFCDCVIRELREHVDATQKKSP